jgi:transitional endoplasmic reticulum ATPase
MVEKKLKVAEAIQDDVNSGRVRIDSGVMKELDIRPGDAVKVKGEKETIAIADRAYPGDIGLDIIRMDGLIRRNAKAGVGELVTVAKTEVKEAKRVSIAPDRKGFVIKAPNELFKQGLMGRVLIKGDVVSISLGGRRQRADAEIFNEMFNLPFDALGGLGFGDLRFRVLDTTPKDAVIVTELTEISFNPEATSDTIKEEAPRVEVNYEDIGGLDEEIKKIREMVELPLKHPEIFERLGIEPPKGVLLHGPPGTGKTLVAKAVASETNSNFILINGPEIMSKFYGQSEANLRKKFEDAEKNAPSIIFIDEIDAIATKREEVHGEVEKRVVAQLLALMDGLNSRGKVVVIAATNVPNMIDPALRRPGRFDREIEIGVPDKAGRLNILKIHTRGMPLAKNIDLDEIAEVTYGFVGADLSALAKESAMIVLRRILPDLNLKEDTPIPIEVLEKLIVTQKDLRDTLKVVRPSAMREVLVEIPTVKWDDIGGMQGVKQELIEAVEWPLKNPKAFSRLGVKPPKGILLYGAPGTGKTMLAKAVASESKANFILVKGPELLSKWVGESEKAMRKIFEKARQTAPTIIFFDEVDALVPRRGMSSDSNVTERLVNQMLTEMDGLMELHDVVIIAATNRPDMLDTAILRPGRFDRLILTPVPNAKEREEILKVHTKNMPLQNVNLKEIAEKTEGYVGADLESVCREAAILSLRKDMKAEKIPMSSFEEALKKVRASVSKDVDEAYQELGKHFTAARGKEMKEDKPSYYG